MSEKKTSKNQLHITRIELVKELRVFDQGFSIDFDVPLTILIGENGSGKSTLLDLIRTEYKPGGKEDLWVPIGLEGFAKITGIKPSGEHIKYFDFHSSDMKYSTVLGIDINSQIDAQRLSSGIGVTVQLKSRGILTAENSLVLIDEAARGYSPNLQVQFAQGIYLSTIAHRNQVILSTHSEHIMRLEDLPGCKLYSVEHRKYMSLDEFRTAHIKPFR